MTSGRSEFEIAILIVLCVLTIFIFPVIQGPYSVVNGPATAFRAARAATHVRIAIVQAALKSRARRVASPIAVLVSMVRSNAAVQSSRVGEIRTILRC